MVKNHPANGGDVGSIPGLGRPPGEGNGNPLYYSCLEISCTEESDGLQSMGSKRAGHDLATKPLPPMFSMFISFGRNYSKICSEDLLMI